jgi:serine/threonine protein kinase
MSNSLRIGRFQILKALGRGAQGAVYLGRDPDLDRHVAIKLVSGAVGSASTDTNEADGWPQARNLAQLRHPNIVALHEVGRFHNFTFLVFEYLEGRPLRDELTESGALALPAAYSTMLQITDAMAYAHAKGILHLDLNPNNIMRDQEGKPRIMDFDLSRRVDTPGLSEYITGTVPYMAPEHFLRHPLDPRTDVYALGQILYELLSGILAVPMSDSATMIAAICSEDADFDVLLPVDPTGAFTEVVRKATTKNPDERFPHARAMHDALRAAWERACRGTPPKDAIMHGTIAFVLKRIERRGDFPAISSTLAKINELTSSESQTPLSHLTSVVLRDVALTSRLLKMANSTYYARSPGTVKSMSDAINLLGLEQVRLTCNGLACFGHFSSRKQDVRLREESVTAFLAGLIARHLATHAKSRQVEEAFLAGMLFNLGRMLALFYFPEDYEELEELVRGGATPDEAARSVFGIPLSEIGQGVGAAWGLPAITIDCMRDAPAAGEPAQVDIMRRIVRFANELTAVDAATDAAGEHIAACAQQVTAPGLYLDLFSTHALLQAAIDKFRTFAPALEVDLRKSPCVLRMEAWLAANEAHRAALHATDPQDDARAA